MAFEQVIGQQEVRQRLQQMVSEDRLPHALMLCGPMGCGKMALALGFAVQLLSRTANDEAMLRKLEHPDLHFTYPTIKLPSMNADHKPVSDDFAREWHELIMAGPFFTMNEWLEMMGGENQQAIITAGESDDLIRKLSLKSSQGGYKVSLIWLPERMNIECANKILKLLEEPPSQTVFILVCEEPDKLLETIRSRVQRIDVKNIADEDVLQAMLSITDKLGKDLRALKKASAVSKEDERIKRLSMRFLEEAYKEALKSDEPFETVRNKYNAELALVKDRSVRLKEELSYLFDFASRAFKEGNEMLILVTEMTVNTYTSKFIARYGCDEYMKYKDEMMLEERTGALKEEIRELVEFTE